MERRACSLNTYYRDEIEKIIYLRKRIANVLATSGIYPDRAAVDDRLFSIDFKLSLFRYEEIKESSKFDVKKMNEHFMSIYQDLLILYKLVFEFSIDKLEKTRAFVETHLSELETLAEICQKKNDLETNNASIGKTLFFQGSGFDQYTDNYMTTLNLGSIRVSPGSKVSCFISGRYFKTENVLFKLGSFSCPPFDLNHDYIKIPGEPKYNSYRYELPKDLKKNNITELRPEKTKINANNGYIIFGGKDNILVSSHGINKTIIKKQDEAISLNDEIGKISFYVIGGTYINFEFSKAPLSQNFSGYSIQNMQSHKKIVMEYSGQFSFNFNTNGTVYAVKKRGITKSDRLFYPGSEDIRDFLIEEYAQNDYKTYNLSAIIQQSNEYTPLINMVAVKELSKFDEDFEYD